MKRKQSIKLRMESKKRSALGFTLVELIVTVGILGGLLTLAVPSYKRQVWRARQNEAQVSLSQVYTAEKSFFVDNGTYAGCLEYIGVKVNSVRYYTFGFGTDMGSACGPNGNVTCLSYKFDRDGAATAACADVAPGSNYYIANARANSSDGLPPYPGTALSLTPTTRTFTALARGFISSPGMPDEWSIDHNRVMYNSTTGI